MSPRDHLENELLRHGASLRALAWDIVRDSHAAEDVVQEAWKRSLDSPPARGGGLGAWLATVVRNVASKHRRSELRRQRREAAAARPERIEDHAEDVARREVLRRVVDELLALEEPYRGTLMLRYFEGLPPGAIAGRTATPLATVKSRLQRGLVILRARLSDLRQRPAWAPLIPILGGTIVAKTAKLSIVAGLLILAGAALIWSLAARGSSGVAVTGGSPGALIADPLTAELEQPEAASSRTEQPPVEQTWSGLDHPYEYEVIAVVRDEWGLPVPGAGVGIAPFGSERNALPDRTGPDGTLRATWRGKTPTMDVEIALGGGHYPRRTTVAAGAPRFLHLGEPVGSCKSCHEQPAGGGPQQVIRLALRPGTGDGTYDLVLQHGCGRAQERDAVEMREGLHPFARFCDPGTGVEEYGGTEVHSILSYSSFTVFDSQGVKLNLGEYTPALRAIASGQPQEEEPAVPPAVFSGTVYGPDGQPVEGAVVAWGPAPDQIVGRTATDGSGDFRAEIEGGTTLHVRAGGGDHGLRTDQVALMPGQITRWEPVLELGSVIRGRAVARDDTPLNNWRVEYEGLDRPWFDACTVGEDGTFVLPNLPGGAGRLLLWSTHDNEKLPNLVIPSVIPDTGDLELRSAKADGVLRIAPLPAGDGVKFAELEARVWQEASGRAATMTRKPELMAFELGHLPPGWYRVELRVPGAGWREMARTWVDGEGLSDLGTTTLRAPGILEIGDQDMAAGAAAEIYLRRPDVDVRMLYGASEGRVPLPVGEYWWLCRDETGRADQRAFEVRAGETTVLPDSQR